MIILFTHTFNQPVLNVPYVNFMLAVWKPTPISSKAVRAIVTMFKPSSAPQAGGNCPHRLHSHALMVNDHPNEIITPVLVGLEAMDFH